MPYDEAIAGRRDGALRREVPRERARRRHLRAGGNDNTTTRQQRRRTLIASRRSCAAARTAPHRRDRRVRHREREQRRLRPAPHRGADRPARRRVRPRTAGDASRGSAERLNATPAEIESRVDALQAELDAERRRAAAVRARRPAARRRTRSLQRPRRSATRRWSSRAWRRRTWRRCARWATCCARSSGSAVVVLGAVSGDRPSFLAMATKDLAGKKVHAGNLVKQVAAVAGGGGGGRPDMAQAGGKDASKLDEALELARRLAREPRRWPTLVAASINSAGLTPSAASNRQPAILTPVTEPRPPGRLLGVDVGERRIGVAVSDGTLAVPLTIVEHRRPRATTSIASPRSFASNDGADGGRRPAAAGVRRRRRAGAPHPPFRRRARPPHRRPARLSRRALLAPFARPRPSGRRHRASAAASSPSTITPPRMILQSYIDAASVAGHDAARASAPSSRSWRSAPDRAASRWYVAQTPGSVFSDESEHVIPAPDRDRHPVIVTIEQGREREGDRRRTREAGHHPQQPAVRGHGRRHRRAEFTRGRRLRVRPWASPVVEVVDRIAHGQDGVARGADPGGPPRPRRLAISSSRRASCRRSGLPRRAREVAYSEPFLAQTDTQQPGGLHLPGEVRVSSATRRRTTSWTRSPRLPDERRRQGPARGPGSHARRGGDAGIDRGARSAGPVGAADHRQRLSQPPAAPASRCRPTRRCNTRWRAPMRRAWRSTATGRRI